MDEQMTLPTAVEEMEQLERSFRLVAQGLDGDIKELRTVLFELYDKVVEMQPHPLAPDGQPTSWADRATDEDWGKLGQWVDWLIRTYEVPTSTIVSCWPKHDRMANDLASLWLVWAAATVGPPESDAMLVWHDRWLPSALDRLRTASSACASAKGHTLRPLGPETSVDALRSRMGGHEAPTGAPVHSPS